MFIHGVGMTQFGFQVTPTHMLAYEAVMEALEESKMTIKDIDAIVVATLENEMNGERQRLYGGIMASLFKTHIPIVQVAAYCGGGAAALWNALKLGYENVLVIATDRLAAGTLEDVTEMIMQAGDHIWDQQEGLNFPSACAFFAQHYFKKYNITIDDLNLIPYKNHQNAKLNPKAPFYGKEVTLDQIKSSRVVASPLRVHDCAITVNGAVAVVVSKKPSDIEIVGSALTTDTISLLERKDLTSWKATRLAAEQAYKHAGITPNDIDVVELHDAFSITELMAYEDLGFAEPGKGLELITSKKTFRDGSLPVNPSGGLKARGHPMSPSGLAQVYEIVNQMRGKCDERQIEKPLRYGLTHNVGGIGAVVGVHVIKKVN
ncbi:MAG: thiolase family protein [bacterium]